MPVARGTPENTDGMIKPENRLISIAPVQRNRIAAERLFSARKEVKRFIIIGCAHPLGSMSLREKIF